MLTDEAGISEHSLESHTSVLTECHGAIGWVYEHSQSPHSGSSHSVSAQHLLLCKHAFI